MGILIETLLSEANRPGVVVDCALLVDNEVGAKKGMTGMVIKGGYKAFKAIKPSIVENAVNLLLDDFAKILDRHYDQYLESNPDKKMSFSAWASQRNAKMADDLLVVTDDMMDRSNKNALKKIYKGLRKIAQRNVADAIPAVGKLIDKHLA